MSEGAWLRTLSAQRTGDHLLVYLCYFPGPIKAGEQQIARWMKSAIIKAYQASSLTQSSTILTPQGRYLQHGLRGPELRLSRSAKPQPGPVSRILWNTTGWTRSQVKIRPLAGECCKLWSRPNRVVLFCPLCKPSCKMTQEVSVFTC